MKKLDFSPSKHGFHFENRFSELLGLGLCGGMSLAAFNYYRHGLRPRPVEPTPAHLVPRVGRMVAQAGFRS